MDAIVPTDAYASTTNLRPGDRLKSFINSSYFIPVLLIAFVGLWTAIFSVAYFNADLHMDVMETWSIGRHFEWGFWKHPPLMGWIANAWTTVFPLTNWSFRLLAMVNAALALFAVDLISRRFMSNDKRALVILLLLFTPIYQFHAEKFNANTVLLAVWPLATYCFLRSFQDRTVFWSIATGVLCAIAMLGKYYSIFLLVGFVVAACVHPDRRAYLSSRAPWLSLIAGIAAISPHVYWLSTNDFGPFHYAVSEHGGRNLLFSLRCTAMFILTNVACLLLPAFLLVRAMPGLQRIHVRQRLTGGLLLLTIVFAVSFIGPILTVLLMGSDFPPAWHLQGLFLVVLIAVAVIDVPVDRKRLRDLCGLTAALTAAALVLAPFHALYRNDVPLDRGRSFYHQAVSRLADEWHTAYGKPLERVSGDDGLAFAAAFYLPDHPFYARPFQHQYEWGAPRLTTLQKGWSAICFADDVICAIWMTKIANETGNSKRLNFEVTENLFGLKGASRAVTAIMVPPAQTNDPDQTDPAQGIITDFSARGRE